MAGWMFNFANLRPLAIEIDVYFHWNMNIELNELHDELNQCVLVVVNVL